MPELGCVNSTVIVIALSNFFKNKMEVKQFAEILFLHTSLKGLYAIEIFSFWSACEFMGSPKLQ